MEREDVATGGVLDGAPRVAFLGVYHAATTNGQPPLHSTSLLGLSYVIPSFIFPIPIAGMNLFLAVYDPHLFGGARLRLLRPNGEEVFRADIATESAFAAVANALKGQAGWMMFGSPVTTEQLIFEPGTYPVMLSDGTREQRVGAITYVSLQAPPLTAEEVEAIKLNPRALTGVQWRVHCRHCQNTLKAYVAIERNAEVEADGYVWNRDLPLEWVCSCKKTRVPLGPVRDNLHGFLRGTVEQLPAGMLDIGALHRLAAIEAMCAEFFALLNRNPSEEEVHAFLREHELFFHLFSPVRVMNKARILARQNCDFAVRTSAKELILIEIERPGTKLLKKGGRVAAPLQHAFDQVRSWMDAVTDDRDAVLRELKIKPDQIGAIRGVVIAGRDGAYPADELRKFKRADHGSVRFMTYDDLLLAMVSLLESLKASEPALRSQTK